MSKAKFLGIPEGGKRAGWMEMEGGSGPIDPKRLPEGYPYKEGGGKIVDAEIALTAISSSFSGATFSGIAPLVEGETYKLAVSFPDIPDDYSISGEFVATAEDGEDGLYLGPWAFGCMKVWCRSSGDYELMNSGGEEVPGHITIEAPETIHTMDPEFLPADVGGGGMVVKLVIPVEGAPVLDKTHEEIKAALLAGNRVEIHQSISDMPGVVYVYHAAGIAPDDDKPISFYCVEPIHSHSPSDAIAFNVLRIHDDDGLDMIRYRIAATYA